MKKDGWVLLQRKKKHWRNWGSLFFICTKHSLKFHTTLHSMVTNKVQEWNITGNIKQSQSTSKKMYKNPADTHTNTLHTVPKLSQLYKETLWYLQKKIDSDNICWTFCVHRALSAAANDKFNFHQTLQPLSLTLSCSCFSWFFLSYGPLGNIGLLFEAKYLVSVPPWALSLHAWIMYKGNKLNCGMLRQQERIFCVSINNEKFPLEWSTTIKLNEVIKTRSECLCFYLQQNKQNVIIEIIAEKSWALNLQQIFLLPKVVVIQSLCFLKCILHECHQMKMSPSSLIWVPPCRDILHILVMLK